VLLDCAQCGAPLDVQENDWLATCGYCQHSQSVRRNIQKRPDDWRQTPSNWLPPAHWTPPPQVPAASVPLTYNPTAARRKSSGIVLAAVMLALIIAGATTAVVFGVRGGAHASSDGLPIDHGAQAWDGSTTLRCEGSITLQAVEVVARATPAIQLGSGCNLIIEGSTITANQLFSGPGSNGTVVIRNSKLTLTRGLRTDGNRNISINGSTLVMKPTAGTALFEMTGNGQIILQGTEVHLAVPRGEVIVGRCAGNGCLSLSKSSLKVLSGDGPIVLLETKGNGVGLLSDVQLEAGGRPLLMRCSRKPALTRVELHGSKLSGPGAN
jgi:hypothetical protein